MALEIERKWLIDPASIPFDLEEAERHRIEQSYLSFYPQVRLRCIDEGARYLMTVKVSAAASDVSSTHDSLARCEYEAEITAESYSRLRPQTQGKTLLKTRYVVPAEQGRFWEIDIYEGAFAGLAVAEMEFDSEEAAAAFPTPEWALRDISTNPAFKNVVMAQ